MKGNSLDRLGLTSLTTAMLLASTAAWAQFDGTLDSTVFDYKYEQDVTSNLQDLDGNSTEDWRALSLPTVSGGIALFDTVDVYRSDASGRLTAAQFPEDSAFTAEFSIKVTTTGTEDTHGALAILLRDNNTSDESQSWIYIGKSTVRYRFGTNNTDVVDLATGLNNTNSFHSYRIARLATNAAINSTYFVWRDGTLLTPVGVSEFQDPALAGTQGFYVGAFGNAQDQFELDWMRFDNDGAFAPIVIPEPSMICLCLLGSMLVWRNRRRGHA